MNKKIILIRLTIIGFLLFILIVGCTNSEQQKNKQNELVEAELIEISGSDTMVFTSLEVAMKNPSSVKILHLSNDNLKRLGRFPLEVLEFTELKELKLNACRLAYIPKEIGKLKKIECLDIGNNYLTSLPKEIGDLELLETLIVNDNFDLKGFPKEIENLQNLKHLDYSLCIINHFPKEICKLKNLEHLNAMKTGLDTIPPCIGNLKELNTLYVNNNPLYFIPKEIGNLEKLEKMWLINTKVKDIPNEFSNLTQLNELLVFPDKQMRKRLKKLVPHTKVK